jgi:hypothetical protein
LQAESATSAPTQLTQLQVTTAAKLQAAKLAEVKATIVKSLPQQQQHYKQFINDIHQSKLSNYI